MRISDLETSRVAILGLGREGQAVRRWIRRRYPHKPLSLYSESAVEIGLGKKLDPVIDKLHVGPFDVVELKQFDLLVRSAGISVYREELCQLRSEGVKFTSASSLWFADNPSAKSICVSGTLGKSTTAKLIAHLLEYAGIDVCLAGNIGKPMLDFEDEKADWWVIELSSYQISDLEAKPDIVVLLNVSEEHLDWHRGMENYISDKLKLAGMISGGRVIANHSERILREKLEGRSDIIWFNRPGGWQAGKTGVFYHAGTRKLRIEAPDSLPGEHNMKNLAAALSVVDALGLSIPEIDQGLLSFAGLPHRLQLVGKRNGIRYVNDSISTTPVSVTAAVQTLGYKGLVLLLGGMDRGLDWSGFANEMVKQTPYAIIMMPDNGRRIGACLKRAGVEPGAGFHAVANMKEAVELAEKLVPEKGCVLLSPGAPSFPRYKNYEDRGEQFTRCLGF